MLLTPEAKSVLDNEYIGFAFDSKDLAKYSQLFNRKATGMWDPTGPFRDGKYPTKKLSKEEQYSGRWLNLNDIFGDLSPSFSVEMEWYYNIGSWEGYCKYVGSDHSKKMRRPKTSMLKYRTWKGIAQDEEETS